MTETSDIAALDALAQAELLTRRELSPLELVEGAIARIERLDSKLNAVVSRDFERARERAKQAVPGSAPFAGVPILLKDIGAEEAGQPCYAGMRALRQADYRPTQTSYFLQRLLGAGFIPLGRTNMPELALLPTSEPAVYGATRNPYSLEHSAGGSSGGSAAAVASGMVAVAHASDGGGSIRGPASMCGLVGLKPSRGRASFGPTRGERWSSLSVELVLCRSVRDCAALLDVVAGSEIGDPYFAPPPAMPFASAIARAPKALRVGVLAQGLRGVPLATECADAVAATARTLTALGHRVSEEVPEALEEAEAPMLFVTLVAANTARALEAYGAALGRPLGSSDVEPLTHALAERGRTLRAVEHLETIERVHAYGRRLSAFFRAFDLLVTPTLGALPPAIGELTSTPEEPFRALIRSTPYGLYTLPWNLSGQPAISLPLAESRGGLPIGVQLVAGYGREDLLLQVAAQLEVASPWSTRRPSIHGFQIVRAKRASRGVGPAEFTSAGRGGASRPERASRTPVR
jgi:amidase